MTIKRIERNKRKFVTSVHGLEAFGESLVTATRRSEGSVAETRSCCCCLLQGIDLKKVAKALATRFATGSSVTKNPQGLDEIVVQGDVSDDILEIIEEAAEGKGGQLGTLLKSVPADNVVLTEEKKK